MLNGIIAILYINNIFRKANTLRFCVNYINYIIYFILRKQQHVCEIGQ
jgi:hypothetical protein